MREPKKSVRFAVVGLGWFGQSAVLPAFKGGKRRAKLCALVSGDEAKRVRLAREHDVPHSYGYDEYDGLLRSGEIDAVYLVLPNSLHAEYAVRAAEAGIHVLCEKPMAVTEADCWRMIEAAQASGVKLMVGYRLHFEAANLAAIEHARSGKIGELRYLATVFSQQVHEGNSRLDRALGGGPLLDIGIYGINAARYLFRAEPCEVVAFAESRADDSRFAQVPEQVAVLLRFPGERLASLVVGFGAADVSRFDLVGTEGSVHLDPAFHHTGDLAMEVRFDGRTMRRKYHARDQVAAEIDYFADCVLHGREPSPSGIEGLADVRIIEAIEQSLASRAPVRVRALEPERRPTPEQERYVPPHAEPSLVNARPPK